MALTNDSSLLTGDMPAMAPTVPYLSRILEQGQHRTVVEYRFDKLIPQPPGRSSKVEVTVTARDFKQSVTLTPHHDLASLPKGLREVMVKELTRQIDDLCRRALGC